MASGTRGPGSPPIAAGAYDNTGNVFLDVLVGWGWLDVGGDRNITYYFDETSPYHLWTPFEKGIWRAALQEWANVANITTQELPSPSGADLVETWTNSATITAQFGLAPSGIPFGGAHFLPHQADGSLGEFNNAYLFSYYTQSALATGGYGYSIFVHEIGHALGLSHPHGMVQLEDEPTFPGVTVAGDLGDFGYNQMVYTLMSYNRGPYMSPTALDYGLPAAPMAFDIAAIQFLYGANTTYHSGSDTYVLPDDNAAGTAWRCIWDTGGTDTIRYNGKLNATIDLRPATLVFGDPIAGGAISKADGIFGGFTIANGVVIENAIGGSGNDTLVGNSADNFLDGGAGDDAVVYYGPSSAYKVTDIGGNSFRVTGPDGADTISNVERLVFSDTTLSPSVASQGWDDTPGTPNLGVRSLPYVVAGVGDFNKDGTDDVLWRDPNTGNLDEWKIVNGQWAGSTPLGSHGTDWVVAGIGDLDGDGTANVLWRNANTGQMDEWRMAGGNWAGSVPLGSHGPDWQVAGIGDFNGDGTKDILWRNPSTGQMDEWRMANGNWSSSIVFGSHGTDWVVAGIGDFNHDGNDDVLWRNPATGQMDEWKLVNGQWAGSIDLGFFNAAWQVAAVKDFNGDGTTDVLWRNPATGQVDGWVMENGQWARSFSLASMNPAYQVAGSGDFDHSGIGDLLWRHPLTGQTGEWLVAPV